MASHFLHRINRLDYKLPNMKTLHSRWKSFIETPNLRFSLFIQNTSHLEEESEDLSSQMPSPSFLVIHNTSWGCEYDVAELTRRQQIVCPFFNIIDWDIEAGRDHAALVQASGQVHDDLAGTVVVHDLEFADVSVLHHDCEELDDDLGAGTQEHLALTALLGVVDAFQGIG